jgi:peptidoglycan/LPS O-acetylase OafA/YrhL
VVAILPPFPLAELSYRLLEAPMLRLRPRQGQFSGHPDENRS